MNVKSVKRSDLGWIHVLPEEISLSVASIREGAAKITIDAMMMRVVCIGKVVAGLRADRSLRCKNNYSP